MSPSPASTSTRPLAVRDGRTVPYITAWTGERDLSLSSLLLDTDGLRYRKEHGEDRDGLGGLWERWTDDYGDGDPRWGAVHSERQRTAMQHLRCQVCAGDASRTRKGYLFLGRGPATAASLENQVTPQPPLCLGCALIARRQCKHLRGHCVAFRAKKCPVWGVIGSAYVAHPRVGRARPTDRLELDKEVWVPYGTPELREVLGSQLVRELRRVTVVDLDAEAAA